MNPVALFFFQAISDFRLDAVSTKNIGGVTTAPGLIAGNAADEACAFAQNDPYGLMMALLGMGIVFSALMLIYIIFTNTPKLYTTSFKSQLKAVFSRKRQIIPVENNLEQEPRQRENLTGEVNAAIAVAIHLYRSELHDHENTVLTIKKVARTYSPWSSKIYGLRNLQ
jgi:glutaconyl-CoA/methylmalonyl-CoA decarboxylase subunit delta